MISEGAMPDTKVQVPTSVSEANGILLEGKFGVFTNLPHQDIVPIPGHACVSLVGLLRQLLALGVPIGFTEEKNSDGSLTT